MNIIITKEVLYRGKLISIYQLKPNSNIKILVECSHGQREIRWNRRYQLCRKCVSEAGLYNTCKKGRKITWGDKISKAKKGIVEEKKLKQLYSNCRVCRKRFLFHPNKKFCSPQCCADLWHKSNPEWFEKYYINNKNIINDQNRQWSRNNRDKVNALSAKYRAVKLLATPNWLTTTHLKQMEFYYLISNLLEKLNNTKYHVDHIVPLQGKTVSGLHVPWNLQILTETENLKKSNKSCI